MEESSDKQDSIIAFEGVADSHSSENSKHEENVAESDSNEGKNDPDASPKQEDSKEGSSSPTKAADESIPANQTEGLYYTEMRSLPLQDQGKLQNELMYDNVPTTPSKELDIYEELSAAREKNSSKEAVTEADEQSAQKGEAFLKMKKKMKKKKTLPEHKGTDNAEKEDSTIYDVVNDSKRFKTAGQMETIMNDYSVNSLTKEFPEVAPRTYSKTKLFPLEEESSSDSKIGRLRKWAPLLWSFVAIAIALVVLVVSLVSTFTELDKLRTEIASLKRATPQLQLPDNSSMQQLAESISDLKQHISYNVSELVQQADFAIQEIYVLQNETLQLRDDIDLFQNRSIHLLNHLGEPGQFSTLPVADCSAMAFSSFPGYYWVRNALGSSERVYCAMSRKYPISSCAALPPSSSSGYYWVRTSNGSAVRVYCDMTLECGNITGGWMRVAGLNWTNSSQQCPDGFMERLDSNMNSNTSIRACVSSSSSPGCSSGIEISTLNISYTKVCGRVVGYQIGGTNAFAVQNSSINFPYVDGVSITHSNPRQHIWTFAAARDEITTDQNTLDSKCPCILQNSEADVGNRPPEFVGEDYFCDTGSADGSITNHDLIGEDPLWDGAGCGSTSTCCSFNTPPWFYKQLPQPTTDDIEMRVCRNEHAVHEDVAIEIAEIYIQ